MKRILANICICCCAILAYSQQTLTVDVKADRKPISPLIYGANDPSDIATAIRWGGNRTSGYNWESNYSNGGNDYNQISDQFFYVGNSGAINIPIYPIKNMVNLSNSRKQYKLVTLQAAGFVSADASGAVSVAQTAPSSRWDSIIFRKNAPFTLTPNRTDGVVYIDEMVNYCVKTLGVVGNGGIDAFGIDNEPALWSSTHPLLHPKNVTFSELCEKTSTVGQIVKEISPNSEVYGPMFYGFWDLYGASGIDGYTQEPDKWFFESYLDSIKKMEDVYGKRIVDVMAVHWYPEDKGRIQFWNVNGVLQSKWLRIVNLDNDATAEELIDSGMVYARLQAPRSLWDSAYSPGAKVTGIVGKGLIRKLQKSINERYPGTKLAFTEFKYDAQEHFSGGLAIADVLGVFGREGVYMASKWSPINNDYSKSAYQLYRNYDGNGGAFGNTSVQALNTDNEIFSTVASVDENNNLHIIIINKSKIAQTLNCNLKNGYYSNGKAFGFDQNSMAIIERAPINSITDGEFSYEFPAYSATHLVLEHKEQTQIISAVVKEGKDTEIVLQFNSEVTIADAAASKNEFILADKNNAGFTITEVKQGDSQSIILTLDKSFTGVDTLVSILYRGENITGINSLPIFNFDEFQVLNNLASAPLVLYNAELELTGKEILVNFSKKIKPESIDPANLKVYVNSVAVELDSIKIANTDSISLVMYVKNRVVKYDTVLVANEMQKLQAFDNVYASQFSISVINNGPNYSIIVDSIILSNNYSITMYVDKELVSADLSNVGFELKDGNNNVIPVTISYSSKKIIFTTTTPLSSSKEYYMSYKDKGIVQSFYGGYLDNIVSQQISNTLVAEKDFVIIPSKIQAEDYSVHSSSSQLENCSDVDGGKHIGYIAKNNIFGYNISVPETKKYTLTFRHAGSSHGLVTFKTSLGETTLVVPSTGSWLVWKSSSVVIELPAGEILLEMHMTTPGFNVNWIAIEEGENPSKATIFKTNIPSSGTSATIEFDRFFSVAPDKSEFVFEKNNEPLEVASLVLSATEKNKVLVTFSSPVLKTDVISVSLSSSLAKTTENGEIVQITDLLLTNKSTYTSIESVETNVVFLTPSIVSPNKDIIINPISNCNTSSIAVYSITGEVVGIYNVAEVSNIRISKVGVYVCKYICNSKEYSQYIFVQ